MSKSDWKAELDKLNDVTDAHDVQVIPLDGERLLVFKGGISLKINDRGKVVEFLNREQTKQLREQMKS